ncbi:ABC transporter six-transmembrane domain-containing protein [uncultured Vibrio sp.]|uniref:ABC transporter six-transmembrane domain-containing protein n=1 Tax=uncultured Vibrio sp. TaxID=114054 RepID=UPI0025E8A708|nr:ABC transporter six-transmembrane domain-containing protein [uncultured Vibrio sp.]
MPITTEFTVKAILKQHKKSVTVTWLIVAIENMLLVLLPLFIGFAIDSLLVGELKELFILAGLLTVLIIVSVLRRFYDTRVYGGIRVEMGDAVDRHIMSNPNTQHDISTRNARLDMSRELVDFLENDVPPLMTALIQLIASVAILAYFHLNLGVSAIITGTVILVIYAQFHDYFIRLNHSLNNRMEHQVNALSRVPYRGIRRHLERIKTREILISDAEAIVYGLIFMVLFGFVVINLWLSTLNNNPSAGEIFSIVTYSLEFLEAAILLPITLQTFSRLTEISQRLNKTPNTSSQTGEKTQAQEKMS